MGLLRYVIAPLREMAQFLGDAGPDSLKEPVTHAAPGEKLAIFRDMAGRMERLMPRLAERGVDVPSAIVPHPHRYLALIERIIDSR